MIDELLKTYEKLLKLHEGRSERAEASSNELLELAKKAMGALEKANQNLNEVYAERSKVVLSLARSASRLGHRVGWGLDLSMDPEDAMAWPILYIDLPTGQVSWHMTAEDRKSSSGFPAYAGKYDGHSTEEKYQRLAAWKPHETVYAGEPDRQPLAFCGKVVSGLSCFLRNGHSGPCSTFLPTCACGPGDYHEGVPSSDCPTHGPVPRDDE